MGRLNSVGIETTLRDGGFGDRIPVGGGQDFPYPSQTGPGAHPASYKIDTGSFPGLKRPRRGVDYPPPTTPKLKKEYSYKSTPHLGLRVLF